MRTSDRCWPWSSRSRPPLQPASTGLGLALARIVGIADRLLDESKDWIWIGGKMPDLGDRVSRNPQLLARYAAALPELFAEDVTA